MKWSWLIVGRMRGSRESATEIQASRDVSMTLRSRKRCHLFIRLSRGRAAFKFSRMCLVKISLHLNQFCKLFHHSGDIASIQPGYMFFPVAILHTKCAQCAMNIYSSRWWIMLSVYSNERTVMIKQNHHLWRLWFPPKTVWIINELHWLLGLKKVNSISAIV